jgi:hypothetical protein
MKISFLLDKSDLKLAVELYLASLGHKVTDSDNFVLNADGTVTVDVTYLIPALPPTRSASTAEIELTDRLRELSGRVPSTAPIGQTIDGIEITHYGYAGDSSPDSNSMKGIGDRGNKLTPNLSVAMTKSARSFKFQVESPSTGKQFTLGGYTFRDDDSAPEENMRVDVYDPYYAGVDRGCTPEMLAKSKAEMVAAGILPA